MLLEQGTNLSPVYAILGGTGGIGSALCKRLAAKDARLAIGAREEVKIVGQPWTVCME